MNTTWFSKCDDFEPVRTAVDPSLNDLDAGTIPRGKAWALVFPDCALKDQVHACMVLKCLLNLIGDKLVDDPCDHAGTKACFPIKLEPVSVLAAMKRTTVMCAGV